MHNDAEVIKVPRWALALIISIVLHMIGGAFAAGILWMKVDSIGQRMERIEHKVFPVVLPVVAGGK